ncbi:MAG: hypothetical protein Q4P24_08070 [Rhodobacterales bacterium]|nr:hypothetical protein [Rhodobacterales bacterium]
MAGSRITRGGVALIVAVICGGPAISSVVSSPELKKVKTLTQRFLKDGSSVVSVGSDHSCRSFRPIDIRASQYVSSTGQTVPFDEVARSPAAGLWVIGTAERKMGVAQTSAGEEAVDRIWRIVLKYPVDSMEMDIAGVRRSLTEKLDPAGDSVTLSAEDRIALQAAWRDAHDVTLIGKSSDTGRLVTDTLPSFTGADLNACDEFERGQNPAVMKAIESAPVAVNGAGVAAAGARINADPTEFPVADIPGHTATFDASHQRLGNNGPIRVTWAEKLPSPPDAASLTGCRMTDLGGDIERYRLAQVDGFVSQASEAWITRNEAGEVRQIYIPGVFEALRKPGADQWTADVSVSAFANDPFAIPVYKGCLGSVAIPMLAEADTITEGLRTDAYLTAMERASAFGTLSMDSVGLLMGGGGTSGSGGSGNSGTGSGGVGNGNSGGMGGGNGGSSGGIDGTNGTGGGIAPVNVLPSGGAGKPIVAIPDPPTPVPLPGTLWLYLAGIGLLGWNRFKRTAG